MTNQTTEDIISLVGDVLSAWKDVLKRLQEVKGENKEQFDFSFPVPNVGQSIPEIETRLLGFLDLIKGLNLEGDHALIPNVYFTNLKSTLSSLKKEVTNTQDTLNKIKSEGDGPGVLDKDGLVLTSKTGSFDLDLKPFLKNVHIHIDNGLDHYYVLAPILKGSGFSDFSNSFNKFSEKIKEIQQKQKELEELKDKAEDNHRKVEVSEESATSILSAISGFKEESEKSRKNIAEYEAEVTLKRATIQEIATKAETLRKSVESYQPQFENFQKELDSREATYAEVKNRLEHLLQTGTAEKESLITKLEDIEEEISRLNTQAEDMLKGATVAGLASSFGELRDKLSKDLDTARITFYCAIGFLFLSALPIVAYVIPGLDFLSLGGDKATGAGGFGEILVRALLLLPGAWFAKFAAARHASLFRLKEHYAYKYSVASSVEGFKKQAEPYKDEIAAATFFELTFNPANNMETQGHEERHPNAAMEWLMKKMGATHDGKSS